MATSNHTTPAFRVALRTVGGIPTLLFVAATIALLTIWLAVKRDNDASVYPSITAFLVFAGACGGGLIAAHHPQKNDPDFRDENFSSAVRSKLNQFRRNQDFFLGIVSGFTMLYLTGFLIAISGFPMANDGWPLPHLVTAVTMGTIGFQMYFSVRYASFLKMLVALDGLVDEVNAAPSDHARNTIRLLRKSAFRDEQLYEPPGNIFVTMGITATFLGLAVGLATLDLTAVASSPETRDLSTLSSFIGCMGLALGISMLGVVIAMAAQWLRGHGPAVATEHLLQRASDATASPAQPVG